MAADSKSLVNPANLIHIERENEIGFFRSKLYQASARINPMLAAAQPILSLIDRIKITHSPPKFEVIKENIAHELKAFQSVLSNQKYPRESMGLAHYLLSSTLDETLAKCYEKHQSHDEGFRAFTPASMDGVGPEERFFDILELLLEMPNQYLDLLEIAYHCLNTGFEGKYHFKAHGKQELEELIDQLFDVLEQYRNTKKHQYFNQGVSVPEAKKSKKHWYYIAVGCLGVIALIFCLSHYLLEQKTNHLIDNVLTKNSNVSRIQ